LSGTGVGVLVGTAVGEGKGVGNGGTGVAVAVGAGVGAWQAVRRPASSNAMVAMKRCFILSPLNIGTGV
jgi:hypothetical protein